MNLIDSLFSAGAMENVRLAVIAYSQEYPGHNYFQDWIEIHSVLGLTVEYGSAIAIASLVSTCKSLILSIMKV